MSAGLDASTVTPGSTAPDESLTVPVIVAWAYAMVGSNTASATTCTIPASRRITVPPMSSLFVNAPALTVAFGRQRPPLTAVPQAFTHPQNEWLERAQIFEPGAHRRVNRERTS